MITTNTHHWIYTILTTLLSIFFINSIFSQGQIESLKINNTISKSQDSIYYTEKVFLHFDKPYYSSGELMWFKAYLVSGNTNKPDAKSKIVHVELINTFNKIINSRIIKIKDGGGEGEFYLPKQLKSGKYTVRAYTRFMRNFDESYFFLKRIHIGTSHSLASKEASSIKNTIKEEQKELRTNLKPDIQFFPEGGYMVNNRTSKIGFKAIGSNGKGITVSGSILDSNNKEVLAFETLKFGLGKFEFTPKKGESYKAIINYKGQNYTYNLPEALKKGVAMEVTDFEDNYQILLQSSLPRGIHRLTLTGLQNGKMVTVCQLVGAYRRSGIIIVPKAFLKQGIVQFTISDKTGKPLCERLVFVETDQPEPKITINCNKKDYTKRELIELNIDTDSIIQANMSLTVTDISVVEPDAYGLDIRSYLLLNSELKGEIEQPGYYFESKDPNRKKMLDLLMMTQGWRQFIWKHADENDNSKEFIHETGIRFKGIIKQKLNPKKTVAAEVSLTYMNQNELLDEKTKSPANGQFEFGDYHFNDSTSVIIQAKNYIIKKRRKKDVKKLVMDYNIELDTFAPPAINFIQNNSKKQYYLDSFNTSISADYLIRSRQVRLNSVIPFDDEFEKLDEVVVKQTLRKKEAKQKFKNRYSIYGQPTRRVDMDEIKTFGTNNILAALQGKVPGLRISGNVNNPMSWTSGNGETMRNYQIKITGGGFTLSQGAVPPLILLDNFVVQDISVIYAADVSFVDVLSPARSAIFGSRAMGGVLSIHTKRGNERINDYKKGRSGIINFIYPGYYKARKFYSPNYNIQKPEHKKFDYRTTLYWNPMIKLDEKGKAKISFFSADIETTYRIELQGISKEGLPIVSKAYVNIE